ncbi:carbon-nitrogen hydrolase family protein [Aquimarina sp. AD10]|uniref:carbon-nitrogen hydrolase family protein n=1 Tax=Aquimarina sp. AD10 TaxID=1714849 RepID=UPI000E47FDAF|nr:carbon-nitrogen hydrolase family protein [Aquimarina sp. AD10]AXT63343.1 carbon-nitrogen hydrolase family protein [Aquimarina sp. AD10]RKN00644.1 carbon-nitrogen hydrolase family protein [Aquimarina sp. AD10]
MKIATVQTKSIKGDIAANITNHKKLINSCISLQADAVFFPELSLTGYEPKLAKELAITKEDIRLEPFQELSNRNTITVGVGLPTKSEYGIHISMIIFRPNLPKQIYHKQYLHDDELPYFVTGQDCNIITINDIKVALAICYESLQLVHFKKSIKRGAKYYLTSVAKSKKGVDHSLKHYAKLAQQHSTPILMCNSIGLCDTFESTGTSSIWNSKGKLIAQLDNINQGILIFDTQTEEVIRTQI